MRYPRSHKEEARKKRLARAIAKKGGFGTTIGVDELMASIGLTGGAGRAKQAQVQRRLLMAQRSMNEKLGPSWIAELKAPMDESFDILAIPQ